MKTLNLWIRTCAMAAIIAGCGGLPAAAVAQPAAAPAPANPDYPAFRALLDSINFYGFYKEAIMSGVRTSPDLSDLSANQHDVFLTTFANGLDARRDSLMTSLSQAMLTQFSHDEVARLTALSGGPFMKVLAQALNTYAAGDTHAIDGIDNDPTAAALTTADTDLVAKIFTSMETAVEATGGDVGDCARSAFAAASAVK